MKKEKRKIEIVIISDIHLGTYGCHATEVLDYLNNIDPKILILNGDIIDIWQFSKSYFPEAHLQVINKILKFSTKGTKVYYLTGNHDEFLRKFSDFHLDKISLLDKLVLEIDHKKAWIFHGDVFDASVQHAKWIAKLGGKGYDLLILVNRFVNYILKKLNKPPYSFSKKIKANVKNAVKFIGDFEKTASELAIEKKYDYVICGHIHEPKIETISNTKGRTIYLNSGDWVENLSALEYNNLEWNLFYYKSESNI